MVEAGSMVAPVALMVELRLLPALCDMKRMMFCILLSMFGLLSRSVARAAFGSFVLVVLVMVMASVATAYSRVEALGVEPAGAR